jgi:L-seryl-tRNA(Ser) seleniumtransferase
VSPARVPQVDKVLRHPLLDGLQTKFRRDILTELVRQQLALLREDEPAAGQADEESIAAAVARQARWLLQPGLNKVINATGVVLNTNLGRAPLSTAALNDVVSVADGYCNLEIDLVTGKRGKRSERIVHLLKLLTGAESAVVVNNNAAAVLLCVNALARNREVVVSRGELVEIGGSFRLPDVIESAGSILREVGTTNRTRIADFKNAVNVNTGLLMRCHRSNFEIRGFTEEVTLADLVVLSKAVNVPVLEDLGSGVLVPLPAGLKNEPTVREVVSTGCSLVSFSGDKLLGGPQAGMIVGQRDLIDKLSKHPLYRALRLDKVTLALLERTLVAYLSPQPEQHIPVLNMILKPVSDIKARAEEFARTICATTDKISCAVIETHAAAGGGSLPGEALPSYGVSLSAQKIKPNKLAELLRRSTTPVVAIVQNEKVVLDFRTIHAADQQLLLESVLAVKMID